MDWKRLDTARGQGSALEVDLIEAYAQNKISRRNFVKRGTIIGLSATAMSGIIAACGGSDAATPAASGGGEAAATSAPAATAAPAPAAGGDLRAAIQFGDANSGLDPINMLDLGTYGTVSQTFEYLVGLAPDGNIGATALATDWSPNADATAWTFNLRDNAKWLDGSPLTSADVAATIDRMVVAGAGLAGIVSEGATETPDDTTVVVNLDNANGNLPVLLSIYNPQSLITPVDYSDGTTLDARPEGSGPWMLDTFDATTFTSVFVPNPNWWGPTPNLDSVTLLGFEEQATGLAAIQSREVDMVQGFSAVDGASLISDPNFTVLRPPSANHRQLWFNTQIGQFTDARVRQAVGYCLDRQQMVDTLFEGQAIVANDHPVHPTLPFFDETAVEQRPRDIEKAKALLAEAGVAGGIESVMQVGNIGEVPDLAAIVEQNCAEAGFTLPVNVTDNSDFYGEHWCSGASWGAQPDTAGPTRPCGASAEIGIVDYGHRPVPDIFFGRALATDGDWNSSNYTSAEFDRLLLDYQGAVDVEGQTKAVSGIMQTLHADAPALYPFFYDYLMGHDSSVSGVQVTALGHMQFQNATISA